MSRLAQRGGVPTAKRLGEEGGELHDHLSNLRIQQRHPANESSDICPVCKSSRYLNPNMRFLVNPECYHKMCESCVDRIFSHGPAPCPIAGCRRTLRKHKFRKQTFEDIGVEREVDIRRRIAKIFNRREDEFETLRDYNDYLQEVEDITFNLTNKVDVEETERKINAYAEANKQVIAENDSRASQEAKVQKARAAAAMEQAKLRREAEFREAEEERRERAEGRQDIINRLATGNGDAAHIARQGQQSILKKSLTRRTALEKQQLADDPFDEAQNSGVDTGFTFKGIKQRAEPVEEKPYDPFGGYSDEKKYYVLQDHYDWDWLDNARNDVRHAAGGYDLREFYSRALCEAFSGLGVFIGDEMADIDAAASTSVAMAAATEAAVSKPDIKMEDVFA